MIAAIQQTKEKCFENFQKICRSPLTAKICWVAEQILKVAIASAFSYALPSLSILVNVGLLFVCRYDKGHLSETNKWMNHQYHLYDKVNLLTLAACQEISLPLFVVLGALSLSGLYFDLKREKIEVM